MVLIALSIGWFFLGTNMSESELNLASISQDTYWANQLVPLPPTQFPEDAIFGGTDPFISQDVLHADIGEVSNWDAGTRSSMKVEIVGQADRETIASNGDQAGTASSPANHVSPIEGKDRVEGNEGNECNLDVLGQTLNTSPFSPEAYIAASLHGNASGSERPSGESKQAFESKQVFESKQAFVAEESSLGSSAAKAIQTSYWDQFSRAEFVPGVTPIEAYPVCSEFKQRFPAADSGHEPTDRLAAVEQLQRQQLADTDYFFLANESPDDAANDSTTNQPSNVEAGLIPVEANDNSDLANEVTAADTIDAPDAIRQTDALDLTDYLPQLPNAESAAGEHLLTSVEGTLSGLHQSIAAQSKKQSALPAKPPQASPSQPAAIAHVEEPAVVEQLIEVDGNDGFDFLDLNAFEPRQATFTRGQILLDTGTAKIRVLYKNVDLAIFANGIKITLQ